MALRLVGSMQGLHLLLLENDASQAELIAQELVHLGPEHRIERVESLAALETAIADRRPDAVISELQLPAFSALEALAIVRASESDVPFVLLCTPLDEERAIEAMSRGAQDYVFKSGLARLVPALRRELAEAEARHENAASTAKLEEEEQRYRALIENSIDLVAIVDIDGTIGYTSPSHHHILGYQTAELAGRNAFTFLHPDDRQRVREIFESQAKFPTNSNAVEYRFRHNDGSWRWLESIGRNLFHHPAIGGVVITSRDITESRLLQEQLAQAERLSSIGRLAATVAHEFNNVLMGIQPFVDVIRRHGADREKIVSSTAMIATSVERGRNITQEILRFTQPATPSLQPVHTRQWLERLEQHLREILGTRHHLDLDAHDDPDMMADPGQMAQVVTNIVLNAREAMPSGGAIKIGLSTVQGARVFPFGVIPDTRRYVHISVEDSGSGIEREFLGTIFDPLYTTKKNGTGLGLAVAHQIVHRHEGYIFVESLPGSGTTLHLFIPTAESPAAAVHAPVQAEPSDGSERFNILLVEDDATVAEGIAEVLKLADHQVTVARTGRAAKLAVERREFDAIVLDVSLPDMSGFDVFHHARGIHPTLPVVFSTAHHEPAALESIIGESTHVAYLMKPYDVDALMEELRRVVR